MTIEIRNLEYHSPKSRRTKLNEAERQENTKMAVQKTENNQPLDTARQGSISVSVFDGKFGKSVVVQKSYKKKGDAEWTRSQINLFMNELPNLKTTVDAICTKFANEIAAAQK